MRSQTSMISAMLWSIRSTPAPWSSRTARTTAANSGTSASGSPAAGSSMSTKLGSIASARATPRRRSSPCASEPAGCVLPARSGCSRPSSSSARARAPRAARRRRRARRPRRSRARVRSRNDFECWNVRASPARPRRCGLQPVISRPSSSIVPARREVEPRHQVDERRLAGAVRADQADDLVPVQLERHVVERLHALERARDRARPQRSLRRRAVGFQASGLRSLPCTARGGPGRRPEPPQIVSCRSDLRDDLGRDGADDLRLVALDPDRRGTAGRTRCAATARSSRGPRASAPS